jgi:hypothetical protein
MRIIKLFIVLVLAVALLGCGKRQRQDIVIMPDVSASIDRASLDQAFRAIEGVAGHLQRGDRLTIIPILGDAQAEASGRILRFEVPPNRQPYDGDLKNFRDKLGASLTQLQGHAAAHPGAKTDILGSVSLAEQEFQVSASGSNRILVILSDFIHEDSDLNFRSDSRLRTSANSTKFSQQIVRQEGLTFRGTHVYLGLLRSEEYKSLSGERKSAIRAFWMGYFKVSGAYAQFESDGPGLLGTVLQAR